MRDGAEAYLLHVPTTAVFGVDGLGLEDLPRPVSVVPTTGQDLRRAVTSALAKGLVHS